MCELGALCEIYTPLVSGGSTSNCFAASPNIRKPSWKLNKREVEKRRGSIGRELKCYFCERVNHKIQECIRFKRFKEKNRDINELDMAENESFNKSESIYLWTLETGRGR